MFRPRSGCQSLSSSVFAFLSSAWRRVLEALAHTPTFATLLVVMVVAGGTISVTMLNSAKRIREEERILSVQPFRNGFVAISDVLRVTNIVRRIASSPGIAPKLLIELEAAIDILYVRADTFRNKQVADVSPPLEADAVAALWGLVDMLDTALRSGFGSNPDFDYQGFARDLLIQSEATRSALILYLDDADQQQDKLLAWRADVIVEQAQAQVALSAGASFFALFALMALRAEALERTFRQEAEARARYLAYFDPLTDLPNRVSFRSRSEVMLRMHPDGAAFLMDLDNFKGINDTLGHAIGDQVLKVTGERLSRLIDGPNRIAARLSGDEFAAWITGCSRAELEDLGRRIVAACSEPILTEGQVVNPGVSIGIAVQGDLPDSVPASVETMLRVADFALYASKTAGRGRATLSNPDLIRRFTDHRAIVEDLHQASGSGGLLVFLQPKFQLATRLPNGFEALGRGQRGDQLVMPDYFIEIAEQNGLIGDIDRFMLREAVTLIADYNRSRGTSYSININISAINLNSDRIIGSVADTLTATGLQPDLLTLAVTETAMIKNRGNAEAVLRALRKLGVRIAVDDFGAGHASLIYVRTLRPDELKIDRSLLQEIETSAEARLVLERMISVGLGLGIDVVVEGVETEAQAELVAEMGCTIGQGFLWGFPEPALAALDRATEQHRAAQRVATVLPSWDRDVQGDAKITGATRAGRPD